MLKRKYFKEGNEFKLATKTAKLTMDDLLAGSELKALKTGDMVEGTVMSVRKARSLDRSGPATAWA